MSSRRSSKRNRRPRPVRRHGFFEGLEPRLMLAADWENPGQRLDVSDDRAVSPVDALIGINRLNDIGPTTFGPRPADSEEPYYDANGDGSHSPIDVLVVVNALNDQLPLLSAALANDTAPGDSTNRDRLTRDAATNVKVALGGDVALQASLDDPDLDNLVDLALSAGTDFQLDASLLETLSGGTLADGHHTLRLRGVSGEIASEVLAYDFTLDTTAPAPVLATGNLFRVAPNQLDIDFGEPLANTITSANFSLTRIDGSTVSITDATETSGNVRLSLADRLPDADFRLNFTGTAEDLAGNQAGSLDRMFTVADPTGVRQVSPANGDEMVSVTRETIVRFDEPVDPATVTPDSFHLIANGARLPGRIVVSSTERFATYFYNSPLPASTEVRVVIDGNSIIGRDGLPLDANGDDEPGGMSTADFRTLPLTRIAGTNLFGFVRDSMTGEPIVGATIRVDAFPEANAVTDATGRFLLEDMPAPEFFVHVDGSTATNIADGFTYPNVGKPFHSVPGQEVQLEKNGMVFDIFLPPQALADAVPLSATTATNVGFGAVGKSVLAEMFPNVDPAMFDAMSVRFEPGAAVDNQGNPATQATIIPVPPNRLPAPLSPTENPALVVSIQTGGATNFDVPAVVSFPNIEGLAPGTQMLLRSFDHDAGKWVTNGTATVSEDGTSVRSDAGVGIQAPGWHFIEFATTATGNPCNNFCAAAQFNDFLVGMGQPPIQVRIVTQPSNSTVNWTITPIGTHSGTVSPTQGTGQQFSFTPNVADVRPTGGSRSPNSAAEYRVSFTVMQPDGQTFSDSATITQSVRARLRQEYVDFGLAVPPIADVAPAIGTANFQPIEFSRNSNYSPWVINGGMQDIAQNTRTAFGNPITISSAYRNPQRNRAVGGVANSVHMSGGAVDMQPGGSGSMVELYRAAIGVGPGLVLLERGPTQLLPGNWNPPNANHTFSGPGGSVVIGDSNNDGLPETVTQLNPPTAMIPSVTNFPYDGGTNFRILDGNGNGRIDVGETLALDHNGLTPLATYFQNATHVHADNRRSVTSSSTPTGLRAETNIGTANAEGANVSTAQGFGSDSRLYYRFELSNGFQLSGRSSRAGVISEVLTPNTDYTLTVYQASTNLSHIYQGLANASGAVTSLGTLIVDEFGGPDTDGDGIPDVGEQAIGTNPNSSDSDNDGITDDAEITQGLDPLGGRAFPTGIVASLPVMGEAKGVVSVGDADNPEARTVFIASGSHGLAIVDNSQFDRPIVQGQLDLPGDSVAVAVDSNNGIALVASSVGLHRVDVSDPMSPTLIETISLLGGSKAVEVFGQTVYVGNGNAVISFDTVNGERIDSLNLGVTEVTGVTREGSILFAMQANGTLSTIDISRFNLRRLDTLAMNGAGGQLFAGNGIVYAAGATTGQGGYLTADASDPADLQFLADEGIPFGTVIPGRAIVANGSGLGVLVGSGGGGNFLELMDASDPASNFNRTGVSFALPAALLGVALGGGLAFVATGSAGLQVVNMLPFDADGMPPVATITPPPDADAATAGIQVVEGASIPIIAEVTDDVQVRNVQLLVDGQLVANALAFPWRLTVTPRMFMPGESNQITVQVRAVDTGGNSSLSDPLTLEIVPDTVAPRIVSQSPTDGAVRTLSFRSVRIAFDEIMNPSTLTTANIRILPMAGGPAISPEEFLVRDEGASVQIRYPGFAPGEYRLELQADALTDLAGNPLGATSQTSGFTIIDSALPEIELVDIGDAILSANDDGSTGRIDLGFELNVFGQTFDSFFINNNGNVTFDASLSQFTAEGFPQDQPIIAPFWADVDTTGNGSGKVHLNQGTSPEWRGLKGFRVTKLLG